MTSVTRSQITNEVMTTPDTWAVALVDNTVTTLVFGSFINVAAATSANTLPPVSNTPANTNTETLPTETVSPAGNNLLRGIVILIIISAVLLLVAVLVVVLSARRSAV